MFELNKTEIHEFRELLTGQFEGTASWRSDLVERFPDDPRNEDAMKDLSRLADTVKDVPDTLMAAYICFSKGEGEADYDVDATMQATERQSEMMRSVGFSSGYQDAVEFVRKLVASHE